MNGIEVQNVGKRYGGVTALENVSLRFEENKIYGLLGRNGAGKTSLLNVIAGRIFADSGGVTLAGERILENDAALRKIYMMGEKTLYPENMRVGAAFRWTKQFYPEFDTEYALKLAGRFELDIDKKVKSLSTGYISSFKLIIALSVNAPYILFDEPVLGLDANNRDLFYRLLIEKFSTNPCTVVISTHLIEEVSSVIEDVVIIKKGSVIRNEPREAFLEKAYAVSGSEQKVNAYLADKNVIGAESLGGFKTAYILSDDPPEAPGGELILKKPDLQTLFIQLTNS